MGQPRRLTCFDCSALRVGRRKRCDDCQRRHDRERLKAWREENVVRVRAQQKRANRARYARDPEARKRGVREWQHANRPRSNAYFREARRRRDALILGATVEQVDYLAVAERDGWICGICTEPVDRDAQWPDPMGPSVDHIRPLSKGGEHSYANVQLAHRGCNSRKGATWDNLVA